MQSDPAQVQAAYEALLKALGVASVTSGTVNLHVDPQGRLASFDVQIHRKVLTPKK